MSADDVQATEIAWPTLTEEERNRLHACPECGTSSWGHSDASRSAGSGACNRNVSMARAYAVEVLVAERTADLRAKVAAVDELGANIGHYKEAQRAFGAMGVDAGAAGRILSNLRSALNADVRAALAVTRPGKPPASTGGGHPS